MFDFNERECIIETGDWRSKDTEASKEGITTDTSGVARTRDSWPPSCDRDSQVKREHMTTQELKEAGQRLFKAGQYSDAIPLLKSAAEAFPKDESLWQELVLAAHNGGQYEEAVEFAKQGISQIPRSDWLWRHLGDELTQVDRLDEAEKALNNARTLNPKADWLWRYLAGMYHKRKDLEKEIEALEYLDVLGEANSTDMNQLGIAYHNLHNYAKAVEFYSRSATLAPDTAPFFNMGLVFNDREVSQDADAADAYRRALALNPGYERAKEQLEATKRKLIPLAVKAREVASGLVQPNEYFQFYVSPFEALRLDVDDPFDELDVKTVQRAKKRLLQEIELNGGKVSWLDDCTLDRSRALALDDELHSEEKRSYHWAIFENKRLLRFLTRGDIEHFLYSDDYFPKATLELLDEEPEFRAFLSKPFARQYNLELTRAIEHRLLPIVEVLFDGRRWVEPEDEDICLGGTLKCVQQLVEQMEAMARWSTDTTFAVAEVEQFLSQQSIVEVFNLLPTAFRDEQTRFVAAIRSVAIDYNNRHDDSEAAVAILNLCKRFQFKSVDLNKRLEDDARALEGILKEKEKQKVFANLKPISSAPSLRTVNGIGFALYGATDRDVGTGSCLATYYFVFLAIPIFPICRYRVCPTEGGYRFFGKAPLRAFDKWHLFIALAFLACLTIYIGVKSASSGGSYSSAPSRSTYRSPSTPGTSTSESGSAYRVPSDVIGELERERQRIEAEKGWMEQMISQLDNLGREIERERLYINSASQLAEFNRKVDNYNRLLEEAREKNRLLNQMIDRYNGKLQNYGR